MFMVALWTGLCSSRTSYHLLRRGDSVLNLEAPLMYAISGVSNSYGASLDEGFFAAGVDSFGSGDGRVRSGEGLLRMTRSVLDGLEFARIAMAADTGVPIQHPARSGSMLFALRMNTSAI